MKVNEGAARKENIRMMFCCVPRLTVRGIVCAILLLPLATSFFVTPPSSLLCSKVACPKRSLSRLSSPSLSAKAWRRQWAHSRNEIVAHSGKTDGSDEDDASVADDADWYESVINAC